MQHEVVQYFRDQLRGAREVILRDSEAFEEVIVILERLGHVLCNTGDGLARFKVPLAILAAKSPLAIDVPKDFPQYHLSFDSLFELVREGRNTAIHEGALARHLTAHAVELAVILEDALMAQAYTASEYMVRNPVIAAAWQPLSFIRQTMLANSFSYLPVQTKIAGRVRWKIVSDAAVAKYLRGAPTQRERSQRLRKLLRNAIKKKVVSLASPKCCGPDTPIADVLDEKSSLPILVVGGKKQELLGIVTAYDLL